jgi:hypothetical protein
MSDLINYFISSEGSFDDASLEFDKLVNYLSTLENFKVQIKGEKASLFCFDSGRESFITFKEKPTSDSIFNNQIVYSCEIDDWQSTKSLNKAIKNYGYRLFNPVLGFFLTNNENLIDLYNSAVEEKVKKIFSLVNHSGKVINLNRICGIFFSRFLISFLSISLEKI